MAITLKVGVKTTLEDPEGKLNENLGKSSN